MAAERPELRGAERVGVRLGLLDARFLACELVVGGDHEDEAIDAVLSRRGPVYE